MTTGWVESGGAVGVDVRWWRERVLRPVRSRRIALAVTMTVRMGTLRRASLADVIASKSFHIGKSNQLQTFLTLPYSDVAPAKSPSLAHWGGRLGTEILRMKCVQRERSVDAKHNSER